MIALSTLSSLVAHDVANAPRFLVLKMLRLSAQDFCRQSDYWQEDDTFPLTGADDYTIAYSSIVNPCRVVEVKLDGKKLKAKVDYFESNRGTIELYNKALSGQLTLIVSVEPKNECNEIDDDLANFYQQGIVAGAVARLLRMPEKSWSNPREVKRHEDIFSTQFRAARRERLDKNARYSKKKKKHTFY
jgi:hypothetical protein